MDVYRHSWTVHHRRNEFVSLVIIVVELEVTFSPVFAGFGLYEMTTTPPSGNACTAQIDWMLPYYSMSLSVTTLCALVILCRIVMGPHIGRRTRWLWINVIVESSLLFAAGPILLLVIYITSDMRTSCPLLAVTMSTVSLSSILYLLRAKMSFPGLGTYPCHCSSTERCDDAGRSAVGPFRSSGQRTVIWVKSKRIKPLDFRKLRFEKNLLYSYG